MTRTEPCEDGAAAVMARGVHLSRRGREVLRAVDLTVGCGTVHGVVGPAGSGKTALMDVIRGACRVEAGTVRLLGRSSPSHDPALDPALRARVGAQLQQDAFFPRATVWEQLLTTAAVFRASAARAEQVRGAFDLTRVRDVRVDRLPAVGRRRLAVACAVLHRPELLILDEPAFGLDDEARHALVGLLPDVLEEVTTVVYATRHAQDAELLCDVVSVLDEGRVLATDAPAGLMAAQGAATLTDAVARMTREDHRS